EVRDQRRGPVGEVVGADAEPDVAVAGADRQADAIERGGLGQVYQRRPELVRAHRNIGERVASQTGAVRDRADAIAGYQRPRGVTSVDARHLGLDQAVHHRSAVVERVGLFQRQVAGLARYAGLATSRRENHLPDPPYPDTHRAPTTDGG